MATIPELFDSLTTYIRSVIQDKIDLAEQASAEAVAARNLSQSWRDSSKAYSESAATSAQNSASAADAAVQQAITDLVGQAPETMDTLEEFAAALGNDPNFSTSVFAEIGKRALAADVVAALESKAAAGAENTAQWDHVSGKPSAFPTNAGQITASGTPSSSTVFYGDGAWRTPPNTTYSALTQADAELGISTTSRAITAQVLKAAIEYHAGKKSQTLTQTAYDALPTKDPAVTYNIIAGS